MRREADLVMGLAFSQNLSHIILLEKDHPEELAGQLNGPGGKVEKKDTSCRERMADEFKSEACVKTVKEEWIYVSTFTNPKGKKVAVYCSCGDKFLKAKTGETEKVFVFETEEALAQPNLLPEVPELIHASRALLKQIYE